MLNSIFNLKFSNKIKVEEIKKPTQMNNLKRMITNRN